MGLAASQARLLSITSRLSDNELRAQLINNQKIRLATESSNASDTYVAALNNAKMMFTNYDKDNNKSYQDLTFNALTAFNPYNNQYGLANQNGNILVSETDAINFQLSNDLENFLGQYGLKYETSFFEANNLGKYYDDVNGLYLYSSYDANGVETPVYLTKPDGVPYKLEELKVMYLGSEGGTPHIGYDQIPTDTTFIAYTNALDYATLKSDAVIAAASPAVQTWLKHTPAGTNSVSLDNIVSKLESVSNDAEVASYMADLATLFTNIQGELGGTEVADTYFDGFIDAAKSWQVSSSETSESIDFGGTLNDTDISNNIVFIGNDDVEVGETFYGVTYDTAGYLAGVYSYTYDSDGKLSNGTLLGDTSWTEYKETTDDGTEVTYASMTDFEWIYAKRSDGSDDTSKKIGFTYTESDASEKDSSGTWITEMSDTETYSDLTWGTVDGQSTVSVERTSNANNSEQAAKVAKALVTNFLQTYSNVINYYNLLGPCDASGNYDSSNLTNTVFYSATDPQKTQLKEAAALYDTAMEAFYRSINGWTVTNSDGSESWEPGLAGVIWGVADSGNSNNKTIAHDDLLDVFDLDWILTQKDTVVEGFQSVTDFYALEEVFNAYGEPIYAWVDETDSTGNQDAYSKVQWYTNLYNRMQQGYTTLQNGLASSKEWIKFALESGLVVMEQVDSASAWKSFEYGACSDITEQTDTEAVALAEAEYNRAMNKIEAKDQRYDLELKNIDTEHTALQTEYESIKSVIEKNIGRTFKIYS